MAKRTRRCVDCKTDISNRGNKSTRCKPCQDVRRQLLERNHPERPKCVDDDGTCSPSRLKRGRCSRHYYTARRDNGGQIPQLPRACATCGVTFTPVRSDAVCCSPECNWRRQDALSAVNHPERPCETCGKKFKPKRYDQRYCSIDCIADRAVRATRRWVAQNRDKSTNLYHRYQARKNGNAGSVGVSSRDWARLVNRHGGCCAYCNQPAKRLTVEHVIPVSRGGRHAIGNVLPACLSCNSSKGDLLLIEFKVRRRMVRLRDRVAVESPARIGGPDVFAGVQYEQLALPLGVGG